MLRKFAIAAATLVTGISVAMVVAQRAPVASTEGATPGAQQSPPPIPVAEVVVRTVRDTADFTGTLEAVETVEVRPRVGGAIEAIAFPEGSLVKRGAALFQIDPRPYQATYARAHAELRQAQEALALAERDRERAAKLHADGVIPARELDKLTSERDGARARVDAVRAAVRAAALDVEYTRIRSPIDGRVDQALVTRGDLVSSGGAGATLLTTIVSVDPMRVTFDIDEPTYVQLVAAGMTDVQVRVGLDGEHGHPREARLEFIGNQVDASTGTAKVRAVIHNGDGQLRPGQFARVRLETGAAKPAVLVRDQAISTDQRGRYVLTVSDAGQLEARPVELGPVVDGLRVVRRGLAPGDRIVVGGLARPGMTINPQVEPMQPVARAEVRR